MLRPTPNPARCPYCRGNDTSGRIGGLGGTFALCTRCGLPAFVSPLGGRLVRLTPRALAQLREQLAGLPRFIHPAFSDRWTLDHYMRVIAWCN